MSRVWNDLNLQSLTTKVRLRYSKSFNSPGGWRSLSCGETGTSMEIVPVFKMQNCLKWFQGDVGNALTAAV
jgi:hypothetical protein